MKSLTLALFLITSSYATAEEVESKVKCECSCEGSMGETILNGPNLTLDATSTNYSLPNMRTPKECREQNGEKCEGFAQNSDKTAKWKLNYCEGTWVPNKTESS